MAPYPLGDGPIVGLRTAFMHTANLHRIIFMEYTAPRHGLTWRAVAVLDYPRATVLLPRGQYLYIGTSADSNKVVYIFRLRLQETNQLTGLTLYSSLDSSSKVVSPQVGPSGNFSSSQHELPARCPWRSLLGEPFAGQFGDVSAFRDNPIRRLY